MNVIRTLRSDHGCPWDREQTHESLKKYLIEESYETMEAIDNKDMDNLCEELGDVLLQVALHSVIAEENEEFTIDDVVEGERLKMIRRHPHVFAEQIAITSDEVLMKWEDIKSLEKEKMTAIEDMDTIPRAFPALLRAEKVLKKAMRYEEQNITIDEMLSILNSEVKNLQIAIENGEDDRISEKFGNLLFQMINLSLVLHLNAENSLTKATNAFINRFVDIFSLADKNGRRLWDISPSTE